MSTAHWAGLTIHNHPYPPSETRYLLESFIWGVFQRLFLESWNLALSFEFCLTCPKVDFSPELLSCIYLFFFFGLSVILAFESNDCIKHEMCKHLIWCPKWWFANIHISYSDPPFYSIFYIYSRRLTRCLLSAKFCMMELFRQLLISAVWWLIPCSCCSSCCLPWFRGLPWAWKLGIKGSGADWWRQMAPWLVILVTWGSSCVLPGK